MMKNPVVMCDNCMGHGRICYDDAIGISTSCGLCYGKKQVAFNGEQLASSFLRINLWLKLTGNELRLRAKGDAWEAQVFYQGRIGVGNDVTMERALAKAFDMAIEFMNEEGVAATA